MTQTLTGSLYRINIINKIMYTAMSDMSDYSPNKNSWRVFHALF